MPRGHDRVVRRATTSPLRRVGASSSWSCQPSHGLSTASRLAELLLADARTLDACFSVRLTKKPRWALSWSSGRFLAPRTPCSDQDRWVRIRSVSWPPLLGVLPVRLRLLAAGQGPAARRTRSTPRRTRPPGVGRLLDLEDAVDRCGRGRPGRGRRPRHAAGQAGEEAAPGGPGRRSRGRWSARRAGTRRSGPAGWRPARPGPPARRTGRRRPTSSRSAGRPRSAHTVAARASKSSPAEGQETVEGVAVGVHLATGRRPGRRSAGRARPRPPPPRSGGPGRRAASRRARRRAPGSGSRR